MVPQGQCLNLYSCTFAGHFSLHKNKLLVPRGNQLLRHSWKMLSTLLLWRLHTLVNVLLIYGYAFHAHARGGHSHRRRVQSCDRGQDAVKRSRHFLGVGQTVKQCAGALSTALLAMKRHGRSFCACAVNRWSRVKGKNPAWSSG